MRSALVVALVLLPRLLAAPVPVTPPASAAAREQLRAESLGYAQQLLSVATQVSSSYIRPVKRLALLREGLRGLHEAARQPVPSGLEADLKRAGTDESLIELLVKVREKLGNHEALHGRAALLASCRALLRSLDPHSDVTIESERKYQPWGDQPAGLGFELADHVGVGPYRILRVLPGTPAQRAGLRPGDEITHLGKRTLKGMKREEVAGLLGPRSPSLARVGFNVEIGDLAQPASTPAPVTLSLARLGRDPWTVKLEHQERKPESVFGVQRRDDDSWEFFADRERRIAHVRIEGLDRGTALALADVLGRLQDQKMTALILDLRWSPGGFLDEAIGVAGLFLGDCVIATVRSREREEVKYHNTQAKRFEKLPVVVLINGQTSGGSELIAAALQDHKRAAVAGQRSLGKASVQTALYVDIPGASLKLTSGEFLRPSGKNLHRKPESGSRDDWGIRPEAGLEFPLSPQLTRTLKQNWELQTLRPGSDNKILPLDDPSNDPQRQAVLAHLGQGVVPTKPSSNSR